MASDREIALEQAAVALLSEAKAMGIDLAKLREEASTGILGNKMYRWVEGHHVTGSVDAIDYLISGVK